MSTNKERRNKQEAQEVSQVYHDTWLLLRKYRDVIWSINASIMQAQRQFHLEFVSDVQEFLDKFGESEQEHSGRLHDYVECIERSYEMIRIVDKAIELMRMKHKNGEEYYLILYYSFLSPREFPNVQDIIEALKSQVAHISYRTYYRKRNEAIKVLDSLLWGYSSRDTLETLEQFVPKKLQ